MSDHLPANRFGALLGGLFQTGTTLIKRGTAMGPLVPIVFLYAVLCGIGAWLFRDVAVYQGLPVITVFLLVVGAIALAHYLFHYSRFAKHDPDRLQSEQYRLESHRMQYLSAKDRQAPLPPDVLDDPDHNPPLPAECPDQTTTERDP